MELLYEDLTYRINGCAYRVFEEMGYGYMEKVYENAMAVEFEAQSLRYRRQAALPVYYRGVLVGDYIADFLVEDVVIIELKVVKELADTHTAQCLNYLKASGLRSCLLINFSENGVKVKRVIR